MLPMHVDRIVTAVRAAVTFWYAICAQLPVLIGTPAKPLHSFDSTAARGSEACKASGEAVLAQSQLLE